MLIKFKKSIKANAPANTGDIRTLKVALNHLGYYKPPEDIGISDTPDADMVAALKEFQSDNGLNPSGEITPPDDNTEKSIRNLYARLPQSGQQYIWVTVGDNRVRDSHAALDGTIRTFGEGLMPGEEPNCRCSAEPVPKNKCEDEKDKVAEAEDRVEDLSNRLHDLMLELDRLIAQDDTVISKAQTNIGLQGLLPWILTIPIGEIGHIAELLRRYFGITITGDLAKAAEESRRQRRTIRQRVEHIKDQIAIILAQLRKAAKELEKAKDKLRECMNGG